MQIGMMTDILLLIVGCIAALYCHVLARRLNRFTTLEAGMGGAIAVLSSQVDEMTRATQQTQRLVTEADKLLAARIAQAEALAQRLELLSAAFHDLDPEAGSGETAPKVQGRARVLRRRRSLAEDRDYRDYVEAAE